MLAGRLGDAERVLARLRGVRLDRREGRNPGDPRSAARRGTCPRGSRRGGGTAEPDRRGGRRRQRGRGRAGRWRMARATVLARNGSTADAERLARRRPSWRRRPCPLVQVSTLLTLGACCCSGIGLPRLGRRPKTPWPWPSARATWRHRRWPTPAGECAPLPTGTPSCAGKVTGRAPQRRSAGQVAAVGRQADAGQIGGVVACQKDGAAATSSARASRRIPCRAEQAVEDFLGHAGRGRLERRGVDDAGQIAFTRTPLWPYSSAAVLVSGSSPAFAAA